MKVPNTERGLALVLVLWVLALLAVIVGSQLVDARAAIALARNQVAASQARALADAGVYRAISDIVNGKAGSIWPTPETTVQWPFGDGMVRTRVQYEIGKLDLNVGSPLLWRKLLVGTGLTAEAADRLTDAVEDFKDADNLKRPNGAEAADYAAAGLKYGPKNAPFASVAELQQVFGMTPDLYRRLAPYVTVYSGRSFVDTRFAAKGLVHSLQKSNDEMDQDVSSGGGMERRNKASAKPTLPLALFSNIYTIDAAGKIGSFISGVQVTIVVSPLKGGVYTVVDWKEGDERLFNKMD